MRTLKKKPESGKLGKQLSLGCMAVWTVSIAGLMHEAAVWTARPLTMPVYT